MAALDVAIVVSAAAIRSGVCADKPLAFHALSVWSAFVLFANLGNELGARPGAILFLVAAGVAALVAFSRSGTPAAARLRIRDQRRDMGMLLAALGLQLGLFLVPLSVLPEHTFIAGHLVVDDSVTHAVMMRGLEAVRGEYAPWYWLAFYPAGFHAVVFALGPLLQSADVPTFLLPVSMWAASFLALGILMLLHEEGYHRRWSATLIAASPAAAFLVGTSVYLNFVGHISLLPFLAGSLIIAAAWTPTDLRGRGLVLALAPAAAAAATYGLLGLTAIGFAVTLRFAWELRQPDRMRVLLRETVRACMVPSAIVGLVAIIIVSAPVARRIVMGYSFFMEQTASVGNLPGGFLSPFHITGLWIGGVDYRSELPGRESPASMVLAALLIGQVWLVARANLSRTAIIAILTLGAPVVASAVVIRSPYVNFKYLCLFTSIWVPLALVGLSRWIERLPGGRAAGPFGAIAMALVALVATSLASYRLLPALPEHWFREMALIRNEHFSRGRVLVLSKEDWFHYYRDADDIVPLTYLFQQTYHGEPMREVLVDTAFEADAESFLASHLHGAETRLDVCPAETVGMRYHIYQTSCLTGAQP